MARLRDIAVAVLGVFGVSSCTDRSSSDRPVASVRLPLSSSLGASGDTYLTSGSPNQNHGGETFIRLQSSGKNRGLVFFDKAALQQAVGTNTFLSAALELPIQNAGTNWGATGRPIAVHRLKQESAEYAATWNCAIDATIYNQSADCQGTAAWNMGSADPAQQPWVTSEVPPIS